MGSGIAMFTISPIGGVIADRLRKKRLVLAGQIVPAVVIFATGVLLVTDLITVPLLTAATLVMGLGFAFMGPARQAWVAELVPTEVFPNAVALQQIAQNISQVAAPLLIALLVGTVFGPGGAYLFMASLFVIVLPITIRLPDTSSPSKSGRSIRVELAAGLGYVWRDLQLRILWLGFVGIVVCGFAFQTLLPGLLSEELGRSPTDIGVIFLTLAVAGLVVNLPTGRHGPDRAGVVAAAGRRLRHGTGVRAGGQRSRLHLGRRGRGAPGHRPVGVHAGQQHPPDVHGRAGLPRPGHVPGHDGLRLPRPCWPRCGARWPTSWGSGPPSTSSAQSPLP